MATRARKNDLERVRDLVDKRIAERRQRSDGDIVASPRDDSIMLGMKATTARLFANWDYFAARFAGAAAHWRAERELRRRADEVPAAERGGWLGRVTGKASEPPPAPEIPNDVTRMIRSRAWQVGDLDLLRLHLEEESSSGERAIHVDALAWRLADLPAPEAWWARWRAHFDGPLREHHRSHRAGRERAVAEAVEIDRRVAEGLFWIGRTAEAHALLDRVLVEASDWSEGRVRLWSDETPDVRMAHLGRVRALHALSRSDGACAAEAVTHARAALLGCVRAGRERDLRHEELPMIHVIALSMAEPTAAEVLALREHLPWLAHLLDRSNLAG